MNNRGLLIVLTGIDGSGKSTQAQLLADKLREEGLPVTYVWARWKPFLLKPFGSLARRASRAKSSLPQKQSEESSHFKLKSLKSRIFAFSAVRRIWLLLACFDYFLQVYRKVNAPVNGGRILICDRYIFDFIADLSVNFKVGKGGLQNFCNDPAFRIFRLPDLAFHIRIPAEVGYDRKLDGTPLHYLIERAEIYDEMCRVFGMVAIDGTRSESEVFTELTSCLQRSGYGR